MDNYEVTVDYEENDDQESLKNDDDTNKTDNSKSEIAVNNTTDPVYRDISDKFNSVEFTNRINHFLNSSSSSSSSSDTNGLENLNEDDNNNNNNFQNCTTTSGKISRISSTNTSYHDLPSNLNENLKNEKLSAMQHFSPRTNNKINKINKNNKEEDQSSNTNTKNSLLMKHDEPSEKTSKNPPSTAHHNTYEYKSSVSVLKTPCCDDVVKMVDSSFQPSMYLFGGATNNCYSPNSISPSKRTYFSCSYEPKPAVVSSSSVANVAIGCGDHETFMSSRITANCNPNCCLYEPSNNNNKDTEDFRHKDHLNYNKSSTTNFKAQAKEETQLPPSKPAAIDLYAIETKNVLYKKRDVCMSAFDTDPDVLLHKNQFTTTTTTTTTTAPTESMSSSTSRSSNNDKPPISLITKKYLSYNNLQFQDGIVRRPSVSDYDTKFENDYLNIFSLRLKKDSSSNNKNNEAALNSSQDKTNTQFLDYKSSLLTKCPVHNLNTATATHSGGIELPIHYEDEEHDNDRHQCESITDTMESTHLDSDYAKSPVFPPDVYGSRPNTLSSPSRGNYNINNNDNAASRSSGGIYNRNRKEQSLQPYSQSPLKQQIYVSEEKLSQYCDDETNSVLDPECLKLMDKKLKKLMKKNARETKSSVQLDCGEPMDPVSWNIPWKMKNSNDTEARRTANETIESQLTQSFVTNSCPYLPLRDVPVHDLVKKLRHEFELNGDVSSLNAGLDNLWQKIQDHQAKFSERTPAKWETSQPVSGKPPLARQQQHHEKIMQSEMHEASLLKNFVQNPTKAFIDDVDERGSSLHTNDHKYNNNANSERVKSQSMLNIPKYVDQTLIEEEIQKSPPLKVSITKGSPSDRHMRKDQVKELVLQRKNKHEKRINLLEKLLKIERVHTDKLRKILQLSQEDQFICDSLLEKLDQTNELDELNAGEFEKNLLDQNLDEMLLEQETDVSSRLAVTATMPHQHSPASIKNEFANNKKAAADLIQRQLEESRNSLDKPLDLAEATPNQSRVRYPMPKATSWFFPVENQSSQHEYRENRETVCCHKNATDENLPCQYECWCAMQKMNLQEAFQLYKYELISRSRQRLRDIKVREARRRVENEIGRQSSYASLRNQLHQYHQAHGSSTSLSQHYQSRNLSVKGGSATAAAAPRSKASVNRVFLVDRASSQNYLSPQPRGPMTADQIKEQTKKKYQRLPEVQQRQIKKKLEDDKKKNRIKSHIYKKAIQQKVLSDGPNFKRSFKALGYSIQ